ncbi:MAG: tRNA glutamyl-Q(34) synthetase GluQRS [Arthrobacter sp.]|uniref:tRNA glutamyl-Q(34) synthetase GluQRS n=1 Tax=unclassified Arthrobacter TaxID=235627 RepID=UPI002653C052|nr:tRNA glutamyl-Q(34) synthetase GluQRS [Micrococcaceae bacterium]MDN6202000.1 tRNA glutamyl-Q(34) synthetase GluQRS [Micrococcaceae bacterium]
MGAGRYAPSPSGELHVGNLRTAVLAWLFARSTGRDFLLRVEDLDRARAGAEELQLADLRAIGIDWDGPAVRQSERPEGYRAAIDALEAAGLLYECFCTRRDIAEAPSAPHAAPGAYPGTCRGLGRAERASRRATRPAALRLRTDVVQFTITDVLHGEYTGVVDDFVVVRNDGVPAYNLAVVVDDALQGIDQVVRGDDLLPSTPRQGYLATLLSGLAGDFHGTELPEYGHVPLVLNDQGRRLAKRDGSVTLAQLDHDGVPPPRVRSLLLESLGLPGGPLAAALDSFDPAGLPLEPWVFGGFTADTSGMQ